MFPKVEPRETLRFEGNKINCFPKDQSLSDLLYSQQRHHPRGGGGGVLPKKLGRGVWPASQNPYPIYDQNQRFFPPYL